MKQNLLESRENLMAVILTAIESQDFNNPVISKGGTLMAQIKQLLDEYEALDRKAEDLVFSIRSILSPNVATVKASAFTNNINYMEIKKESPKQEKQTKFSAKAEGKLRSQRFVKEASEQGISLSNLKGNVYLLPNYERVGIASATERVKGKWFMGLGEGLSRAVLIAEWNGQEMPFVLDKAFYQRILPHLSVSGEQLKFNVLLRNNKWYLKVNSLDAIDISDKLKNFNNLL